jgi:hypothetical protein
MVFVDALPRDARWQKSDQSKRTTRIWMRSEASPIAVEDAGRD